MTSWNRVLTCTVTAVLLGAPIAAQAKEPPQRLAIGQFRGPSAGRIQGAVETGLMSRYYVVPDFSVHKVAKQHGIVLDRDSDFGLVGRTLDVSGFVTARVLNKGASWQVRLYVRRGDTGAPVGSFVLADRRLDRLESQVARHAPARVQRLLARSPSDPPEVAVEPPAESAAASAAGAGAGEAVAVAREEAPPRADRTTPFAELNADGRVFTRSFSYNQNLSGLPDYRLGRSFSAAFDLTIYPDAFAPTLPPLGFVAALEYAPSVKSRAAASDQQIATTVNAYRVGVKYRLNWSEVGLAPQVAYGAQVFETADESGAAPDVRYQFMWAGLEGRWAPGSRFALFGSAAYMYAFSAGAMGNSTRFPRVTADGVAAEGGAAVAIVRGVELRASMGLRRFGLAMHSRPGDETVAGGAVDQITWMGLGLAYRPGELR